MGRVTLGQGIAAIVFGVLEIIMGIMIIVCGFLIKDFVYPFNASLVAVFIIMTVQYIAPGIYGIIAGAKKDIGCMKTFMVFNIIACVSQTVSIFIVTILTAGGWTVVISSFLPVLITLGSSILGYISVCRTPAERNDLNVQVNPYPVAVVGFPESPQFQTPEYPGADGGFPEPPPYQAPEYPGADGGFPDPPPYQAPEYPGADGRFPEPPPYQAPEVVELPEIDVKSGNF